MTRNNKIAFWLLAASAAWTAVAPARAQVTTEPVIQVKPVHPNGKPIRARFEVLHMMSTAIQVRSLVDQREIHTFAYSDQIRGQMQKLFDQGGGYQYGDKVEIQYKPGAEIALKIIGKPSRHL